MQPTLMSAMVMRIAEQRNSNTPRFGILHSGIGIRLARPRLSGTSDFFADRWGSEIDQQGQFSDEPDVGARFYSFGYCLSFLVCRIQPDFKAAMFGHLEYRWPFFSFPGADFKKIGNGFHEMRFESPSMVLFRKIVVSIA